MRIVVIGNPIAKPRQTRMDVWKKRPCVMRYRDWADFCRASAGRASKIHLTQPTCLIIKAFFDYGKTHRAGPHTQKPDFDNLSKACADALFHNDEMIWKSEVTKLWADGGQPRVEIEWF